MTQTRLVVRLSKCPFLHEFSLEAAWPWKKSTVLSLFADRPWLVGKVKSVGVLLSTRITTLHFTNFSECNHWLSLIDQASRVQHIVVNLVQHRKRLKQGRSFRLSLESNVCPLEMLVS